MRFQRNTRAEKMMQDLIPGGRPMMQWAGKAGNYNFIIVRGDDNRYIASYRSTDPADSNTHYIGTNYFEAGILPSFETQTEAERACEAKYKSLRNKDESK